MVTKENSLDSLSDAQRECMKYDNIFGSWYDHYYLNCWELNSLDDPKQEPPPWYYGLPDEDDYALLDKVQPKPKRPCKTTIHGHNFYLIVYDDVYAYGKCCLVVYAM